MERLKTIRIRSRTAIRGGRCAQESLYRQTLEGFRLVGSLPIRQVPVLTQPDCASWRRLRRRFAVAFGVKTRELWPQYLEGSMRVYRVITPIEGAAARAP
jgi:hypothetical protein